MSFGIRDAMKFSLYYSYKWLLKNLHHSSLRGLPSILVARTPLWRWTHFPLFGRCHRLPCFGFQFPCGTAPLVLKRFHFNGPEAEGLTALHTDSRCSCYRVARYIHQDGRTGAAPQGCYIIFETQYSGAGCRPVLFSSGFASTSPVSSPSHNFAHTESEYANNRIVPVNSGL